MEHGTIGSLMNFIDRSVCNFYAVDTLRREFEQAGFSALDPAEKWEILPGGKYYMTKNDSAFFAFVAGTGLPSEGFRIISAHSRSDWSSDVCSSDLRGVRRSDPLHLVRSSVVYCRTGDIAWLRSAASHNPSGAVRPTDAYHSSSGHTFQPCGK